MLRPTRSSAWRFKLLRWIGVFALVGAVALLAIMILPARQNHVYCELVKPGMSKTEIDQALLEIGDQHQIFLDHPSRFSRLPEDGLQDVAIYRAVNWGWNGLADLEYDLWLWLGYDASGRLIWKGRATQTRTGYLATTIVCPWTLIDNLTTPR